MPKSKGRRRPRGRTGVPRPERRTWSPCVCCGYSGQPLVEVCLDPTCACPDLYRCGECLAERPAA